MRQFDSGATRDGADGKYDYEGSLSPLVVEAFAGYMHRHTTCADGSARTADNWQKGIPLDVYMKSGWRHFHDWWKLHRGHRVTSSDDGHSVDEVEALCALMFNVQGYLHVLLTQREKS